MAVTRGFTFSSGLMDTSRRKTWLAIPTWVLAKVAA